MRIISIILFCSICTTKALSQKKCINWIYDLSFKQVVEKAKQEHKNILIDCFATWCLPCKEMDKSVFTNDSIIDIVNTNYLPVKVRMDMPSNDDNYNKNAFSNISYLTTSYSISAYPTILFFDSLGMPLHKVVGFRNVEVFKKDLNDVNDSNTRLYEVLKKYCPGKIDTSELKGLARAFRYSGPEIAGCLAADYLSNKLISELVSDDNLKLMTEFSYDKNVQRIVIDYLNKSVEYCNPENLQIVEAMRAVDTVQKIIYQFLENRFDQLPEGCRYALLHIFKKSAEFKNIANRIMERENDLRLLDKRLITFYADFTKNSQDKGFSIFFKYPLLVDSIMGQIDYSWHITSYVVYNEEILPFWNSSKKEDNIPWGLVYQRIEKKYSTYFADRVVLESKVLLYDYYSKEYDCCWDTYIKLNLERIKKYGIDSNSKFKDLLLNNFIYDAIFKHSNNKNELEYGIRLMKGILKRDPSNANHFDTYANLLYKNGERRKAIYIEKTVLKHAIKQKDNELISLAISNIQKMKKRIPTWVQ